MKFYYQYDAGGWMSVIVKSPGAPLERAQIVSDTSLQEGLKKFDLITKEVIFYKSTYDKDTGEIVEIIEDTTKARISIKDVDILNPN